MTNTAINLAALQAAMAAHLSGDYTIHQRALAFANLSENCKEMVDAVTATMFGPDAEFSSMSASLQQDIVFRAYMGLLRYAADDPGSSQLDQRITEAVSDTLFFAMMDALTASPPSAPDHA